MSCTREERPDIGKQIYNNELSRSDAAVKYSISGAQQRLHETVPGCERLPPKNRVQKDENTARINTYSSRLHLTEYESITKMEFVKKLIKSRFCEARLKKVSK